MDEATNDAVLGYAEQSVETLVDSDYAQKKSRVIAHEIRNQLSICDLYSEIIKRHSESNNNEGVQAALNAINKALKMANNLLISLKTKENSELVLCSLREIVDNATELSKVYLENKNIEFQIEASEDILVLADAEKVVAVIINLVKNASEAFDIIDEDALENGKYIKIKTEKDDTCAKIYVSNNAKGITEPEKIFNEGFSTKTSGNGLGLWICKKSVEEMMGELELTRSTEDYTEFTMKLGTTALIVDLIGKFPTE